MLSDAAVEEGASLSSLPQHVPRAVFMEDVAAYMKGARWLSPTLTARAGRRQPTTLAAVWPPSRSASARLRAQCHSHSLAPPPVCVCAGRSAEEVLGELREAHQKYKYIEQETVQRRRRLALKQPELVKCLAAVELLLARWDRGEAVSALGLGAGCVLGYRVLRVGAAYRPPLVVNPSHAASRSHLYSRFSTTRHSHTPPPQAVLDFALSDQVYAKARVEGANTVNIWLGANIMLEYPLEEARELLVGLRGVGMCVRGGPFE